MNTQNTDNEKALPEGAIKMNVNSFLEQKAVCDVALVKGNEIFRTVYSNLFESTQLCNKQQAELKDLKAKVLDLEKKLANINVS